MAVQIQLRHDTAANWSAVNPILAVGEAGVEIDTQKLKLGNGVLNWSSLSYISGGSGGGGTVVTLNTPAPLGGGGLLNVDRTLTISDFTVASRGAVPTPGGTSTGRFLKDDGTWAAPPFYTDEQVRDVIGAALVAGANVTITPNDPGDTITISATGTGGGGGAVSDGNYTDIVVSGSGAVWNITANAVGATEIAAAAVANAKLANMAANTIKGSVAGGVPADLTAAQAKTVLAITEADVTGLTADLTAKADKATTIPVTAPITGGGTLGTPTAIGITDFTTTSRGAVPNPTAASGRFLKDDGTWSLPPAGASGAGNIFPYMYNTSTAEAGIGTNQIRGNNATFSASTKLWISEITTDGLDVTVGLARIKAGFQIYIQDYTSSARYVTFSVTTDAIDKGAYWEINVTPLTSLGTIPGGKVALQSLSTAQSSTLFSTTTSAPGLTPGANAAGTSAFLRADGTWAAPGMSSGTLAQLNTAITDADVPAALNGLTGVWQGTEAQYAAIGTKVSTVLYAIKP